MNFFLYQGMMIDLLFGIAYIVLAIIFLLWIAFVFHRSYSLVIPGLRPIYWTYFAHFYFMILSFIIISIRPSYTAAISPFTYKNSIACHMMGRFMGVGGTISYFIVTVIPKHLHKSIDVTREFKIIQRKL